MIKDERSKDKKKWRTKGNGKRTKGNAEKLNKLAS